MAYSTIIGDQQPAAAICAAAALPVSVVTQAQIEDVDSPVNNKLISGKKKGALYLMTTTTGSYPVMVCAMGAEASDVWVTVDVTTRVTYSPV